MTKRRIVSIVSIILVISFIGSNMVFAGNIGNKLDQDTYWMKYNADLTSKQGHFDKVSSDATVAADVAQAAMALKASSLNGVAGYWSAMGDIMNEVAAGTLSEEADIQAKLDAGVAAMTETVNK